MFYTRILRIIQTSRIFYVSVEGQGEKTACLSEKKNKQFRILYAI